jgi:hypothetical protein
MYPEPGVISRLPGFTMARALVALPNYNEASTTHVVTSG